MTIPWEACSSVQSLWKELFPDIQHKPPWHRSKPFPSILSVVTQNRDWYCPARGTRRQWWAFPWPPLLQLKKPSDFSYFSYGFPFRNFVFLLQMLSKSLISFWYCGAQNWLQDSKWGHIPKKSRMGQCWTTEKDTAGHSICQSIWQCFIFYLGSIRGMLSYSLPKRQFTYQQVANIFKFSFIGR